MGQARFGVYRDDCEGVHPDTINEYYGTDRQQQPGYSTRDPTVEDVVSKIYSGQDTQTRHKGVEVVQGCCPFQSKAAEEDFYKVLGNIIQARVVPAGYGLLHPEWENGAYPLTETLKIGVRSRKEIEIELREHLWYDRAVLWGQALSTLQLFYNSGVL